MDTRTPGTGPHALLALLADGHARPITSLPGELGLQLRSAYSSVTCLIRRGYAARNEAGEVLITEGGLTALGKGVNITSGPKGPFGSKRVIDNTFRSRAWRSMRIRHHFTIGEIAADAEQDGDSNARENARRYIGRLREAGYIGEFARRRPDTKFGSNGLKQFLLLRNTGPLAPIYRAERRLIFDPNTGEDVPCRPV